ncbi:phage baseplate assembly protein V, partial [Capnocytophaga stomatis]
MSALYNELFFYDGKNIVFGCPENETPEKLIFREDINQLKTISKALPYRYSLYNYSSQDDEYFFTQTDKPISPENAVTQTLLTQVPLFANRGILPAQEPVGYNADTQVFRQGKYQRALGKMHFIEGHSDTCKVRIGGLIQVGYPSEFGIDNSLGVYRVISVHHKVERGSYSNIFRAVPEGMEYAMFEPKTVAYPEIAEVVENNDPQGQGRVKVRFYWQRDKGAETNWIRVQSSDAGVLRDKSGNRGVVFIPEVGDQVMIGFEYGNPHQPFVMGSMFHKTNASEVSNNVRSITT